MKTTNPKTTNPTTSTKKMPTTKNSIEDDDTNAKSESAPPAKPISQDAHDGAATSAAVEPAENAASSASRLANGLKAALGITNRRAQPASAPATAAPRRKPSVRKSSSSSTPPTSSPSTRKAEYELPPIDLLLPNEDVCYEEHEKEVRRKAKILEKTFADFGFNVKVVEIETGPVIAQFEVELEAGLRLSKITSLADDLAIALRVPSVRIVAPIPGKNTVGIEVPNDERQLVRLREVIEEANGKAKKMRIPLFLGKDVAGNPLVVDLADAAAPADRRPHRHGQERVPELDHRLDADDPPARTKCGC